MARDPSLPILIVEDDQDVRSALSDLFGRWRLRFDAVATAPEALDRITGGTRYGLILSDHRLAGGMSGLDLIENVRRLGLDPEPAVALVTGDADSALIGRTAASGVVLMTKPLRPAYLRTLLGLELEPA